MAQIEQSDNSGKKKKGAQKKMTIHVDFTPMVDMNMLLITFFMLCTTLIKPQTLQLLLPSNDDDNITEETQNQAAIEDAITLILDTEYDDNGVPVVEDKKTKHIIYYYEGLPDTTFSSPNFLKVEKFIGNKNKTTRQGIRKILYDRNADVMDEYEELKKDWEDKKITKEEFDSLAKKNAANSKNPDLSERKRPVVIIKTLPTATFEGFVYALDEMQYNQISRYSIERPTSADEKLIEEFKRRNPSK